MGVDPPDAVGEVVDGEPVRPPQLVGDDLGTSCTVHTHPADVGLPGPVSPEGVACRGDRELGGCLWVSLRIDKGSQCVLRCTYIILITLMLFVLL